MYVRTYVCMYACMDVYIYIHKAKYIYIGRAHPYQGFRHVPNQLKGMQHRGQRRNHIKLYATSRSATQGCRRGTGFSQLRSPFCCRAAWGAGQPWRHPAAPTKPRGGGADVVVRRRLWHGVNMDRANSTNQRLVRLSTCNCRDTNI